MTSSKDQPVAADALRTRSQLLAIVISAGFVAAVYFHYWLTAYGGASYPQSTYLFRPDDKMPSITMQHERYRHCGAGITNWVTVMKTDEGVQHACSLYGLLSVSRRFLMGCPPLQLAVSLAMDNYKWIQGMIALSFLAASIALPLRLWEILSLLTFSFLLLPLSSPDYRLIHLFLPIIAFIRCPKVDHQSLTIAAVAGVLIIPKAYIYLSHEITIACVISPLIMVGAAVFICLRAWSRRNEHVSLLYHQWQAKFSQV